MNMSFTTYNQHTSHPIHSIYTSKESLHVARFLYHVCLSVCLSISNVEHIHWQQGCSILPTNKILIYFAENSIFNFDLFGGKQQIFQMFSLKITNKCDFFQGPVFLPCAGLHLNPIWLSGILSFLCYIYYCPCKSVCFVLICIVVSLQ